MTAAMLVWEGRDVATIGDLLTAASKAADERKAADFLAAYREANPEHADANLGYVIGYTSADERQRLYEAYDLTHPMLGGRP